MHVLMSRSVLAESWLKKELEDVILPSHKVVVLGFSHFFVKDEDEYMHIYGPNGEYHNKIDEMFGAYGIKPKQIEWIYYYQQNFKKHEALIKEADIIYFPGGAPDLMFQRINEHQLKRLLENKNKLYIGSSAGAMIQFKNYHISPDNEYPSFKFEEGLDLIHSFRVEVHYRRRKKQKASLRKVHRLTKDDIYAIPDDGAIIYKDDKIKLLGSAKQLYNKKGIIRKK